MSKCARVVEVCIRTACGAFRPACIGRAAPTILRRSPADLWFLRFAGTAWRSRFLSAAQRTLATQLKASVSSIGGNSCRPGYGWLRIQPGRPVPSRIEILDAALPAVTRVGDDWPPTTPRGRWPGVQTVHPGAAGGRRRTGRRSLAERGGVGTDRVCIALCADTAAPTRKPLVAERGGPSPPAIFTVIKHTLSGCWAVGCLRSILGGK